MEAIGGACSTMDGEWESICRILCMDQDPDFTTLLGRTFSSTDDRHISAASFSSSLDFDPLDVEPDGLQPQAEVPLPAPKKRARLPNDVRNRKWQAKKSRKEENSDCYVADNVNEISDGSKETLTTSNSGRKRSDGRTATDPQSLYARRRRERINERLRTLQTLVPNGAKVDISTMLEEAVHYVKFLQLQIKLLSSDEHWMYAPLAYNGFDVGQNYNIFSPYLLP